MAAQRLTDRQARAVRAGGKSVAHGGVGGLVLTPSTSENGKGAWVLTYKDPISGKRVRDTLGRYPEMSILQAGKAAQSVKDLVDKGQSPRLVADNQLQLAKEAASNTLEACCRAHFQDCIDLKVWRSEEEVRKRMRRLEMYVFPLMGKRPIGEITAAEIIRCLKTPLVPKKIGKAVRVSLKESKGVWLDSPEVGSKIIEFLNQVFLKAEASGLRNSNPIPAAKVGLGKVEDTRQAADRHYPSIPFERLPDVVARVLNLRKTQGRVMLLMQILLAARTGAVRFAKWENVDLEAGILKIPSRSERSKTTSDKFYPITPALSKLLKAEKAEIEKWVQAEGYIFKGNGGNRTTSENTLNRALSGLAGSNEYADLLSSDIQGKQAVPHGFRSSFKVWSVSNGYDDRWSEAQLLHETGDKVKQAYDRSILLEERREMMTAWEEYCFSKAGKEKFDEWIK